jgi:uncharacterized OB-fold protein
MTSTQTAEMVPLRAGMFEMPDSIEGKPRLYGQRCKNCKEVFATTGREYCANCGERALEQILLGTSGKVHTFTIVHQQLPGSLMEPPYVIARVTLPEGVSVQTVLCDVEPEDVKIGMPVEICLRQLEEDDEGRAVVNFFFRPGVTS